MTNDTTYHLPKRKKFNDEKKVPGLGGHCLVQNVLSKPKRTLIIYVSDFNYRKYLRQLSLFACFVAKDNGDEKNGGKNYAKTTHCTSTPFRERTYKELVSAYPECHAYVIRLFFTVRPPI